ncbi:MAG: ABC transporter ATP-binding protein [Alphaproteobacteria bacterium]
MIEVDRLCKRFGSITAVDDVSFAVERGEVLGFLGPNGAGKSTTMRIIAGFLAPDSGRAAVCGMDVAKRPIETKRVLGYMPEGAPSYNDMTPLAFLNFVAGMRGFTGADRRRAIGRATAMARLGEVLNQPIDTLSRGFRRRVGLAQALLHDPEVLILDEPTDGLDPNQKHEVRTLIQEMAPDKAILISTHILEEVGAVCTRAVIIAHGRLVADGTPQELEARSPRHNGVIISASAATLGALAPILRDMDGIAEVEVDDDSLFARPQDGRDIFDNVRILVRQRNLDVREVRLERGRLEDVFRSLTTGEASGAGTGTGED